MPFPSRRGLQVGAMPLAATRRLAVLVVFAFAATSLALLVAPRGVFGWDDDTFGPASEAQLVALQNEARTAAGRRALEADGELAAIARWRSRDMADRHYFSHTIEGTSRPVFWYMQHTYGYCFDLAGENIGTVTWRGVSEADATGWVFARFMASEGHRANILGSAWDVVGVGAWKTTGDTYLWTVLFADRCGDAGPAPDATTTPPPGATTPAPDATTMPAPGATTPTPPGVPVAPDGDRWSSASGGW